jgi:WXG100 family type VII secretion target
MPGKIRAQYNDIKQAGQAFSNESNAIQSMSNQLKARTEDLHGKGWQGLGSDAYFKEMEGTILPALKRLEAALNSMSSTMKQVHDLFHNAENDVNQLFTKREL